MSDNLWARGGHERHRALSDAEYAKRIAQIRTEVSAGLPHGAAEEPRKSAPARWDAAPADLPPVPPAERARRRDVPPRSTGDPASPPGGEPWESADAAPWSGDPRSGADAARLDARPPRGGADAAPARRSGPWGAAPAPPTDDEPPRRSRPSGVDSVPLPGGHDEPRRTHPGGADPAARRDHELRSRPSGGEAHRSAAPLTRRRARWAVAAVAAVAIVPPAVAVFVARSPERSAVTVFRVPGQPTDLVADGGRVWVAGPMAGEVWVLDGSSGEAARPPLRVGGTPARLALDRRFAWIADTQHGAIVRAPLRGRGAPRSVPSGPDVADVAVAGGAVWTASSADGTIRILGADGRRRVLRVGARPIALAADERRVVAADAGGAIIRLDARSRRPDGPPVPVGGAPSGIALHRDRAWIADMRAGTVRVVTLDSGLTGPAIAVGRSPVAIAADSRGVFVVCRGDRTLVELDAAGEAVRSRRRLDHAPTALALDPRHVWIAAGEHEVIRVDR